MSAQHILVVEDDPSVRALLKSLLESEGYAVETASDGLGALHSIDAEPPALLLLDLLMPDMSGQRVLREMQADPVRAGIPVIVLTGMATAVPGLEQQLGPEHVIEKPFEVADLLGRVSHLTGKALP